MQLFVRAVVTGFGMALGGALFKKISKRLGLDDPDDKKAATRERAIEPIEPIEGAAQPDLA